ncbi:hypothetical protein [Streptomyces sp. NRRL F-5126]|uniref:hypothetical protein n=1 Tax=Streptomyces sp. NRRL F-5126 TaxID=1463857 RepID=UPI00068AF098|nr:hypothetical protein [Streptomyces sp. NRRL F-5126]
MLTYNDVYNVPLDKLADAMNDWSSMAGKLETLAKTARTTMADKAKDEYWTGSNADVTKPFIDKTAKEFSDAAKEAKGIHAIISEAHTAFKKAQKDLQKLIDHDAPAQGLVIGPHGKVEALHPVESNNLARHDPDFSEIYGKQQSRIRAMQRRVDAIVETCDDADISASNALKADVTPDKHQFSTPAYSSLDAEEAHRAAALARKGAKLTHTQLQQLNELLSDNSKSREFSRDFYKDLGPKESLVFYGQLAESPYGLGNDIDKQRLKDVKVLQKNLGMTLATATQSQGKNDDWPSKWSSQMRHLGTQQLQLSKNTMNPNAAPYGYQLLAGMLRYGDNYNPKFLDPIAEHVTQLHAKDPYMFMQNKGINVPNDPNFFNPSGKDGAGYDPVNGVLEALGHSPDASKHFFHDSPHAYDQDGDLVSGPPKDADGKEIKSYFKFFANGDYQMAPDSTSLDPKDMKAAASYTTDAFGHALESATLGYPYDDPNPDPTEAMKHRDALSASIMKQVITTYGGDSGAELIFKHQQALSDSLGNMAAGYVDDLNWAASGDHADSAFAPSDNSAGHVKIGQVEATQFVSTLGQSPDAYATLSQANRVYADSALEKFAGSNGHSPEWGRLDEVGRFTAGMQGTLDDGRAAEIAAQHGHTAEEYSKSMEERSFWVDLGTGAAVAGGVAALPIAAPAAGVSAVLVPLAMNNGQEVVNHYLGKLTGGWLDTSDQTDQIEQEGRDQSRDVIVTGWKNAQHPLNLFIRNHHLHYGSEHVQSLLSQSDHSYGENSNRAYWLRSKSQTND